MTVSLRGLPFAKMTGSGNDFVFFDGREVPLALVTKPEVIVSICNRHNGIGADGVVVLEPLATAEAQQADVRIHYYNSDGSAADLCGNATLCSTALSAQLGMASPDGMALLTGAGLIHSRIGVEGSAPAEGRLPAASDSKAGGPALERLPEIDLQPVLDIRSTMPIALADGEERVGFAVAGIPHLVILTSDVASVPLAARGPGLRWDPSTGANGANVNWVSPLPGGRWRYRTFERGVEGETLACGTGAVATAVLLARWGLATLPLVTLQTSSGREVQVRLSEAAGEGAGYRPTLRGEGRVVFRGEVGELG